MLNRYPMSRKWPLTTVPLLLAARQENNVATVKTLIKHGAVIPPLEALRQRVSKDSYGRFLALLHWYEANSNDAYIMLTYKDPVKRIFELGQSLAQLESSFKVRHSLRNKTGLFPSLDFDFSASVDPLQDKGISMVSPNVSMLCSLIQIDYPAVLLQLVSQCFSFGALYFDCSLMETRDWLLQLSVLPLCVLPSSIFSSLWFLRCQELWYVPLSTLCSASCAPSIFLFVFLYSQIRAHFRITVYSKQVFVLTAAEI